MKLEHIPEKIDPSLNLEQIREECLDLVKKARLFFRRCSGYSSPLPRCGD